MPINVSLGAAPMLRAVQTIIAGAMASLSTVPALVIGSPMNISGDTIFFYHDGHTDAAKAGPSVIRRTHVFPIHLLLRTGDDDTTEFAILQVDALLSDAFYTNRRLNGTAVTSTLYQRDGKAQAATLFVVYEGAEYRHRFWTLEAAEDISYHFA